MSLAILFHLLCAQHVSDINISIFRNLRLCWWITTSVVLFSVRCRLQPAKRTPPNISRNKSSNSQRTENKTTDVVIHQHSRKLLKMDILMSETCWALNKWNKIASDIKLAFHSSTFPFLYSVLVVSKYPHNSWPNCCSLFFRINVFKNLDASFSKPKPRSQFRNHHGPLLRLGLKFLSFVSIFNGSLLPNWGRLSSVSCWSWKWGTRRHLEHRTYEVACCA